MSLGGPEPLLDGPSAELVPGLVTVAVPARNESASIGPLLASISAQTYPDLQILVVDGASDDDTAELVRAAAADDPRIELVDNPDRVIPKAMNLALRRARGEWFVRIDAHCNVGDDYVERVVGHLRSGRWGGVGGRKDGVGHTSQGRAIAAVMGSKLAQGNSVYHYGTESQTVDHVPFGAYPTALVRELGGWNEDQLVNEDFEFDYRLRQSGRELLFDPAIRIDWDCRQSVGALFRQYRRYGAGKVQTLVQHPESASPRHLAAPVLVGALAAAVPLLAGRRTRPLGLAVLAGYGALVAAGTRQVIDSVDPEDRRWVPAAFVALHLGWGIGFWEEAAATAVGRGGPRRSLEAS
ncbi:glycosyltransferase family 2 protein [Dermatobacter hominis]|uniref:glycosyltransferase family 2 protein n=1 Tax=Dermatobacter hominis TaxID=2884263 RepID=UPI001D100A65|nr:glycosyltransferase family 2 protein [Dermatobacter hominis]UDY37702.1 glycosyltransferase family 2 protein [Dermatobacter hominis]